MDNWYYVGNFGQLGPLQRSDLDDLIRCGAITRDTYVWREGYSEWKRAGAVDELSAHFPAPPVAEATAPYPPPTPLDVRSEVPARFTAPIQPRRRSSKSRVLAGILQILLAGVGRLYLGYIGIGIAQILLIPVCGIGAIWGLIDGIVILVDREARDGSGYPLSD